jgi:excisionase family DNA binding protein
LYPLKNMLYWVNQVKPDEEGVIYAMAENKRVDPEQMLSANEAGKLLGISGKTVIRMMEDGEFPGYKIGFVWKFRRGDIEAYRDSRRYRPKSNEED